MNISKYGVSTSLGVPGASVNFNKRGRRATFWLPGSGLSYQTSRTKWDQQTPPSLPPGARPVQQPAQVGPDLTSNSFVWNAQTKTMAKAALIAFALMLVIATLKAVTNGYIEPLDTLNPTNAEVISNWIGYLGGLPLIVALVTVAVTGRKAGWRSSLLNATGAIIAIPLILLPLIVGTAAAFSTNDEYPFLKDGVGRRLFVKQSKSNCTAGLSKVADVSLAFTDDFCTCYASVFADTTTRTDVLQFNAQAARQKGTAAANKCSQGRVSGSGQPKPPRHDRPVTTH